MTASSVDSVAPAADGVINFLTTCSLSGDYEVTIGENGCSCLKVAAGQSIAGLAVKVANAAALDNAADRNAYKILDAPDGYAGQFNQSSIPEGWAIRHVDKAAYLRCKRGFVMFVR